MNDFTQLDTGLLNREAVLNTLMYLGDYYEPVPSGTSVRDIANIASQRLAKALRDGTLKKDSAEYIDYKRQVDVVKGALKNDPGLGRMVIANQSNEAVDPRTGQLYDQNGLNACTFQDSLSDPSTVYFTIRGTGAGEWPDNGLGLSGLTNATPQQIQATAFFDYVVKKNSWDKNSPDIYLSGHSKGGNKAQYVMMTTAFPELIKNVYSLDGQGVSQEAIDYFKKTLGEAEYERRTNKLYSIAAENDYVNGLGTNEKYGRLVPDQHIFYLKSELDGIKKQHYADCYLTIDGKLTEFTEQGALSKLIQGMSETLMQLPPPVRSVITCGTMGALHLFMSDGADPINGEKIYFAEMFLGVALAIELIPSGVIRALGDEFNINLDWLADVVYGFTIIICWNLNKWALVTGIAIDIVVAVGKKVLELGKNCLEITTQVLNFFANEVNKMREWLRDNLNKGYIYARENPAISVNTSLLQNYANRLWAVNKRATNLDGRLNGLYGQVGLLDLWNFIRADMIVGYSWRLTRCASALSTTANDFDKVENSIRSKIGG